MWNNRADPNRPPPHPNPPGTRRSHAHSPKPASGLVPHQQKSAALRRQCGLCKHRTADSHRPQASSSLRCWLRRPSTVWPSLRRHLKRARRSGRLRAVRNAPRKRATSCEKRAKRAIQKRAIQTRALCKDERFTKRGNAETRDTRGANPETLRLHGVSTQPALPSRRLPNGGRAT